MKMKLYSAAIAAVLIVACHGARPTEPESTTVTADPAVNSIAAPAPVFVLPPATQAWFEGEFQNPNGKFDFKNLSGDPITWTVYSTSFDDQVTVLSAITVTTRPGQNWRDTLNVTCRQVDAQQGIVRVGEKATAAPFAFGFVNGYGKLVHHTQAREGCNTPTPTPTPRATPTPNPTPTPTPSPSPSPTPPPPNICHVSNKGKKDKNFELVVTWKKGGEGHESHLDSSKFCPPDFYASLAQFSTNTNSKDECKVEGPNSNLCSCEVALAKARACRAANDD